MEVRALVWSARARRTPLAELERTERTPSRLGSATPTGRRRSRVPWRTLTIQRVAQQPPRDSGKLLAVTWRLDDWRRVDEFVVPHVHLRLFRPCLLLFVVFHRLLLLRYHPSPSSISSFASSSASPTRSFIYLFLHVRMRTGSECPVAAP